jgi:ABC-type uncharacterized transport system permease subunit
MKLVGIVLACLLMAGLAGAEMPRVGDYVAIVQSIGILERMTFGTIQEINTSSGLVVLERDYVKQHSGFLNWTDVDMPTETIVIGIPTIVSMQHVISPV